jgi:CMP/dCMP kinase
MAKFVITIDGPAGCGKSTIARLVAEKIDASFLDTGAMYRAVTLAAMQRDVNLEDTAAVAEMMDNVKFEFACENSVMRVFVDGREFTDDIRDPQVTDNVHFVASEGSLRRKLVVIQRGFADKHQRIVAEGRDQGTVVFVDADVKIFLTADAAERAKRRKLQLGQAGIEKTTEEISQAINQRDEKDISRDVSPLVAADDAITVDTTDMNVEQVLEKLLCLINTKISPTG